MRIGILAPESSWHFQDLLRATTQVDDRMTIQSVDFRSLAAHIGSGKSPSFFDARSPLHIDVLVVRCMPKGSLQQIVFRMDCLHRIAASGVRVINSPRSMEIAIDKYLSLALMEEAGIAIPESAVCQTVEQGMRWFEAMGGDVVLKPIFGSMGSGLTRLTSAEEAIHMMADFVQRGEVLYLQRFIHHNSFDIRVLVVGDQVYGMRREAAEGDWRTNVAVGGKARFHQVTATERELAIKAACANQCEIAGVDLIYDSQSPKNSTPLVLEVNASPGWEAISQVVDDDVGAAVLKHCLA